MFVVSVSTVSTINVYTHRHGGERAPGVTFFAEAYFSFSLNNHILGSEKSVSHFSKILTRKVFLCTKSLIVCIFEPRYSYTGLPAPHTQLVEVEGGGGSRKYLVMGGLFHL